MNSPRGISKDPDKAMLGGVCAGLAQHFQWSITGTRIVYVLASVLSAAFPGILVYIILWWLLPTAED